MKKVLAILLVVILAVAVMAGCTNTPATSPSASTEPSPSESMDPSTEPSNAEASVKTGLAIINSIAKSKDATAEEDGMAEADSLIVALTVDADGVIQDCMIDMAQSKANFDASGMVVTPLDTEFMTKNELMEDYGMKGNSEIGKEWYEQAEAFAQYVIGMTAEEVGGIAISEGYAADEDLLASVTVHITDFVAGVQKAAANAMDLGAMAGDMVALATTTNIAKSKDVAEDADGLIQVYSTYCAVTLDADNTVTSCIFDASQSNVNFDATGMITTDLTVAPMTKNELMEDYGMGAVSSIGMEWYEQAAAFAAYVTGMTIDDVGAIAISEDGHAADEDVLASVTIHITDFVALVQSAAM